MWQKISVLAISSMLGFAFATPAPVAHIPAPASIANMVKLAAFDQVVVSGSVHVLIDQLNGLKNPVADVRTFGNNAVNLSVKNKVLTISAADIVNNFTPMVHLRVSSLQAVAASQHADLVIRGLSNKNFKITASDNSKIDAMGDVHVSSIQQSGNSRVNVEWVNAGSLTAIVSDNSVLKLAGTADKLVSQTSSHGQIKAEYLRATQAWAKASGASAINITAIQSLAASASQTANVFYYKYPQQLTSRSTQSGNVLQMAWHS